MTRLSTRRPTGPQPLTVGHLVSNYLPLTENWIHTVSCATPDVTPVVLNRGRQIDTGCYPVQTAHHLDELGPRDCRLEADAWETHGYSRTFRIAVRHTACDLLHAHFGTEGVMHLELAASLRVPLVTSFYGYDIGVLPRDATSRNGLAHLFDRGTLFLAEGPAMAQTLAGLGCPTDRIRIAPLPVAVDMGRRPRRNPKDPLILMCGRLVEKKGVDDSLRALAILKGEHRLSFRCLIVGDGPERPRIERLVRDLGLEKVVSLTGSLPLLYQLLHSTTVLLQMSRTARDGDCEGGAPVILAEAQARGVPVVGTRHCDIPATVADGQSGWLVEPGDATAAAERLEELIANPEAARRLGRHGRRRMSELRSVSVCGRRLRTYYGEALELPRPTPRRLWDAGSPPPIALVVDFRRRAADVDGLARLERQMGPGHPSRSAVLQGLAESLDRQGAQIAAARAYRRWGREFPDEKYADFHEARCLLAAGSGRAIAPLRRFLAGHSNPKYAAHVVAQLLSAPPAGTALVIRALRRAVPPLVRLPITVHHLRVSVDRISSPSERSRLKRELMTVASRDVAPLVRLRATANEGGHLPPALERALADLLLLSVRLGHGRARVRLLGLIPVERLRAGLAMYQIASLLKDGSSGDRDVAKGLFATLSRRRSLSVGLRSGACFHLARLARADNQRRQGLAYGRRCLALDTDHAAARVLVNQLERS